MRLFYRHLALILLAFATFWVCVGFLAGRASAQQHPGHAENHDWYKGLTQPGTSYSCCNALTSHGEGDCRPASVWRDERGAVWTRIGGQKVMVPARAVLPDHLNQNPLSGHICEKNGTWYCALVGGAGG